MQALKKKHNHISFECFFKLLGYQNYVMVWSHYLPEECEDMMATLLEEDGVFGSYVNARHLKQVVAVSIHCHQQSSTLHHIHVYSQGFWSS